MGRRAGALRRGFRGRGTVPEKKHTKGGKSDCEVEAESRASKIKERTRKAKKGKCDVDNKKRKFSKWETATHEQRTQKNIETTKRVGEPPGNKAISPFGGVHASVKSPSP